MRLEAIRQLAVVIEAGNAGDEQQVADASGEGEGQGFDGGWWREVVDAAYFGRNLPREPGEVLQGLVSQHYQFELHDAYHSAISVRKNLLY